MVSVSQEALRLGVVGLKLLRSAHCVDESDYHLQFTPKYRWHVFASAVIRRECECLLLDVAKRKLILVAGIGFGSDHVHLFVSNCKNYSVAELVHRLKGDVESYSSESVGRVGAGYWGDGYFYRLVGAVTYNVMKFYVERSQGKH